MWISIPQQLMPTTCPYDLQVRTTHQSAVGFVQSYPFCSDGLQLLNLIAEQAGLPPAAEVVSEQLDDAVIEAEWEGVVSYVDQLQQHHLDKHISLAQHMKSAGVG